jgi:NAD+--asparagine ADP-ribosyltransferase
MSVLNIQKVVVKSRALFSQIDRRFKSEVHHLKSLTEESSSVKVGY